MHFVQYIYLTHYIIIYFFSNLFCSIQKYIICLFLLSKFPDVLPGYYTSERIKSQFSTFIKSISIINSISFLSKPSFIFGLDFSLFFLDFVIDPFDPYQVCIYYFYQNRYVHQKVLSFQVEKYFYLPDWYFKSFCLILSSHFLIPYIHF